MDGYILIASALLPIVADLFFRLFKIENALAKKISAIVLSIVGGLLIVVSKNQSVTTWDELLTLVGAVFITSQVIYVALYKDSLAQKAIGGK